MNRRDAVKQLLKDIGCIVIPPIAIILLVLGWFAANYLTLDHFFEIRTPLSPIFGLEAFPTIGSMFAMIVEAIVFVVAWEIRDRYIELRNMRT